jgi:hypothetical protein
VGTRVILSICVSGAHTFQSHHDTLFVLIHCQAQGPQNVCL